MLTYLLQKKLFISLLFFITIPLLAMETDQKQINVWQAAERGNLTLLQQVPKTWLHKKDAFDQTPLMKATKNSQLKVVQWLLANQVNIDEQDSDGNTALMIAINSVEINQELLTISINFSQQKIIDRTKIIQLLLKKNADVSLKNKYNLTVPAMTKTVLLKSKALIPRIRIEHTIAPGTNLHCFFAHNNHIIAMIEEKKRKQEVIATLMAIKEKTPDVTGDLPIEIAGLIANIEALMPQNQLPIFNLHY